ncbi:MAG: LysR family transcriptional regulator [Mycobacterium sp.]
MPHNGLPWKGNLAIPDIDDIDEVVVRQHSIDLNLAVTLDALLHEKSVTRAAKALNRSQPTVSCSLARLRRHFGDELLQRQGNRYQLTPLGERLAELTPKALAGVVGGVRSPLRI